MGETAPGSGVELGLSLTSRDCDCGIQAASFVVHPDPVALLHQCHLIRGDVFLRRVHVVM